MLVDGVVVKKDEEINLQNNLEDIHIDLVNNTSRCSVTINLFN